MLPIREFQIGDKARVKEFFNQMSGETRGFFNVNSGNENSALAFFDGCDKNTIRWMAVDGDRMVGYVFLWDVGKSIPWLGVAVAEDWKGQRLGQTLLAHARTYALEHGKGGIFLTTHIANVRAQSLYARCGYERLGVHHSGEYLYVLRF